MEHALTASGRLLRDPKLNRDRFRDSTIYTDALGAASWVRGEPSSQAVYDGFFKFIPPPIPLPGVLDML